MASAAWKLQQEIHEALTGDAAVIALIGSRVYDQVPPDATYPFVTIWDSSSVDDSTKTDSGEDHDFTIHVFSRYRGAKEVKEVFDAIHTLVHNKALTLTGHTTVVCQFATSFIFVEPDGLTRHGVQSFRVLTRST